MKPVQHDGSSTGGPEKPFEKPVDKPPLQFTANETVPEDDFHAEPASVPEDQSFAKRFGHLARRG